MIKYQRVIIVLEKLNQFLVNHHDQYMQPTIIEYLGRLKVLRDGENLPNELLKDMQITLFGGMGSLNDLSICRDNKHMVENEKKANEELEELRQKLKTVWREEVGNLR